MWATKGFRVLAALSRQPSSLLRALTVSSLILSSLERSISSLGFPSFLDQCLLMANRLTDPSDDATRTVAFFFLLSRRFIPAGYPHERHGPCRLGSRGESFALHTTSGSASGLPPGRERRRVGSLSPIQASDRTHERQTTSTALR